MPFLPPKIKNLFSLKELGFDVPDFFIIDKDFIINIDLRYKELEHFLVEKNISSVIIRSAGKEEDGELVSLAGQFESSGEIDVKNLNKDLIKEYWTKNELKRAGNLCLFIQEYFKAKYYGVLFTADPSDESYAVVNLSTKAEEITNSGNPEKIIRYMKNDGSWEGLVAGLNPEIFQVIAEIIKKTDNKYPFGADIEIGIDDNKIKLFQIRPITKNKNDVLVLKEKKRLARKYDKDFEKLVWERNQFVQALGEISYETKEFFIDLLNSAHLNNLLYRAGFVDNKKSSSRLDILEFIGNDLYYNNEYDKILFYKKDSFLANFFRVTKIFLHEGEIKKHLKLDREKKTSTEKLFSNFFISGLYFSFYLNQEILKYGTEEFNQRLSNSEKRCQALEPKFSVEEDWRAFKKNNFFLSENPYELSSRRLNDYSQKEILELYYSESENRQSKEQSKKLGLKTEFWLSEKVFWRRKFLEKIFEIRLKKGTFPRDKINNLPKIIKGQNFPYGELSGDTEFIVLGDIDYDRLKYIDEDVNIQDFFGKEIAIKKFPSKWLAHANKFKAIVTAEGNRLSHLAITCREFGIPYELNSKLFIKKTD
jgi:REP element-mobilizing transposase RayT